MLPNDFHGKAVIVTGGTAGIGLATGLAFGRLGAHVFLTHRWGSSDEDEIRALFAAADAPQPSIVEADASAEEDTEALMRVVASSGHDGVEVLVSNVSFAHVSKDFSDLKKKPLKRSMEYSAWPFVGYIQHIHRAFSRYPRYAVGVSSTGPAHFVPGYDFVAASKTVMEVYCRYLQAELLGEDVRINVVRANPVETQSLLGTFGPEFVPFLKRFAPEDFFVEPGEVADSILALCSGLMDSVRGQVLLVDRGTCFNDNVFGLFASRHRRDLK